MLFIFSQKVNHFHRHRVRQPQQQHQLLIQIQVHRREIKASLLVKCVEIRHQVINADAMRCLFDLCLRLEGDVQEVEEGKYVC
jgi:hypothetical protein